MYVVWRDKIKWLFWEKKEHCVCLLITWTASSEFGTYRLCEQRRFRRACASAQSRHNLRCSLIQAVNQEEPSDRKPDPRPLWMSGHAQLKFIMTECSKTQIRLTGLTLSLKVVSNKAMVYSECNRNETFYSIEKLNCSVKFSKRKLISVTKSKSCQSWFS